MVGYAFKIKEGKMQIALIVLSFPPQIPPACQYCTACDKEDR